MVRYGLLVQTVASSARGVVALVDTGPLGITVASQYFGHSLPQP